MIKIRVKRRATSRWMTINLEGETVRFDGYRVEPGPWGEYVLLLTTRGVIQAIIGGVPDNPDADKPYSPKPWGEELSARYPISPNLLFIGSAPMVIPVLDLLDACTGPSKPSVKHQPQGAAFAPSVPYRVDKFEALEPDGGSESSTFQLVAQTDVNLPKDQED